MPTKNMWYFSNNRHKETHPTPYSAFIPDQRQQRDRGFHNDRKMWKPRSQRLGMANKLGEKLLHIWWDNKIKSIQL